MKFGSPMKLAKPLGMAVLVAAVFLALVALSGSARTGAGTAAVNAQTPGTPTGSDAGTTAVVPPADLPPLPQDDVIADPQPAPGTEPVLNPPNAIDVTVGGVGATANPLQPTHDRLNIGVLPWPPIEPDPLAITPNFEIA